jgi:hypothetical protein
MTPVVDLRSARERRSKNAASPMRSGARRRRRLPLLLIAGWTLFCAGQLALAYRDARRGLQATTSARHEMAAGSLDEKQAADRLEGASRAFDRARRRSSSPALLPLRVVPVLGRQLASLRDLASVAAHVTEVAATSAEQVGGALGDALPATDHRVALLRLLADRATTVDKALGEVRFPGGDGLVLPLKRRWDELERSLVATRATLRTAAEGLDGVAEVLEGPRRYLLLAANNAEMRAGSGMFLSVGTIDIRQGSVNVGTLRPSGELTLPGSGVSVDGDVGARWGALQPGREWRNLATTPRFDATAPVAVRMWESLTGEQVDGAMVLDVPLLQAVLAATGPVLVGDEMVTEADVVNRLLHDQYQGVDFHDVQAARREQLGAMAAAVVRALDRGEYSPSRLAAGVAKASRGRHLLAWSAHPGDQRTWETAGVSGSLRPTSLAVSVLNRGGNKLDPFLDAEAELELHPVFDGTGVTVRAKVANNAPTGRSPYITGPHPQSGVNEGDYLGIIAVSVPEAARDIAVDGAPALVATGADGPTQVVAANLLIPRGQETTVTVRFRLPASETSIEVVPSARVPPIRWGAGTQRWVDDAPKVVNWQWE